MSSFIERVSMIREGKNKEDTISIGTFLKNNDTGELGYIVQVAFGKVCIIGLDSSNRYEEMKGVKDVHSFYLKEITDPNEWEVLDV